MAKASETRVPIGPGTRVTLDFAIRLDTGEEVDATKGKPAVFDVGDGNLLPGFEYALFGMKAGEKAEIGLCADRAFGPREEANIRVMGRSAFPPNTDLAEGLVFSFAEPQKTELPGVIFKLDGDQVWVDFNHPLSGRDLIFAVTIHAVEQISNNIIRS